MNILLLFIIFNIIIFMNIIIKAELLNYFLTSSEEYRIILSYIIDYIEHGEREYPKGVKQINRKNIINKYNIQKDIVYKILSELNDKHILRRFGNDTYEIIEENIVENTTNSIKSLSKQKYDNFIDTSITYISNIYGECNILYLHYAVILNTSIPCVTFRIVKTNAIITIPLSDFINDFQEIHSSNIDYFNP